MDDNDGQMIYGDLGGPKLPDICLTGEEKPRKNLTQETCPDRGSNPGPLRDKRACYHWLHSGGPAVKDILLILIDWKWAFINFQFTTVLLRLTFSLFITNGNIDAVEIR